MYGLERSHHIARELATKAIDELSPYAERAARLREIAEYLVLRRT
jgi:geranylgeranyl pyrophosphate synthase